MCTPAVALQGESMHGEVVCVLSLALHEEVYVLRFAHCFAL